VPEGHKTHYLARHHSNLLAGYKLRVTSPQGRFAEDAKQVDGQKLEAVQAVGKHLFYCFPKGRLIHVHLGRYGSFKEHVGAPEPKGLVRMRLMGSTVTIDLNGPTQCRVIDTEKRAEIEAGLGPDPLGDGTCAQAWQRVKTSQQPLGAILLDQSIIAGIGNIFRAELLFELSLSPLRKGSELTATEFRALWKVLLRMMRVSTKHNQIIALTAREAGKPLDRLDSDQRLRIYGKSHCPRCACEIRVLKIAARKLYVCPTCQDLSDAYA
jgi:endonuclease-8